MRIEEFLDGRLELGHAPERAAANLLIRQLGDCPYQKVDLAAIGLATALWDGTVD